jgi:hypothetical protein
MSPYQFFLLTLAATAAAVAAERIYRRRRQRALAALARQWNMHYSARDLFRLAEQVAPRLPVVGAGDVFVEDVIYGVEEEFHRYVFSVAYTLGLVHARRRVVRAASFREPRQHRDPSRWSALELAELSMPLIEQYRTLHDAHARGPSADAAGDHAAGATTP